MPTKAKPLIVKKPGGPKAPKHPAPPDPQQVIGNQAVADLAERVTAADLAPHVGGHRGARANLGLSTFASLHRALKEAEAATGQKRIKKLQVVDELATQWLNRHGARSGSGDDPARRRLALKLVDQVAEERMRLTVGAAQDIYTSAFAKGPAGLKLLMNPFRKNYAPDAEAREAGDAHGLTEAELRAIRVFTDTDYKYMNPATANSKGWLAHAQKDEEAILLHDKPEGLLVEEGTLHTGVAVQGLRKLPEHDGLVQRGAGYTEAEFEAAFTSGKPVVYPSLTSFSKLRSKAEGFARSKTKPLAVITKVKRSGGRDVEPISVNAHEAEVVVLPGSAFRVVAIKPIDVPEQYAGTEDGNQEWIEVTLARAR